MIRSRLRLCIYASLLATCAALFGAPSSTAAGGPSVQPSAVDASTTVELLRVTKVSKPDGMMVASTISCYGSTGGPSWWTENGLRYVGAAARVWCTGIMSRMDMTLTLYWNGNGWASGIDHQFSANTVVASAVGTCIDGGYHATARGTLVPPAGYQPPSSTYAFSTPFVNIDC